ncbi:Serine/threonine-protein kinase HSL1 [Yarrowia sp. E02]|nr:Serine/threonine-protein kinase HSL1 [Yarrowia sp. E02]
MHNPAAVAAASRAYPTDQLAHQIQQQYDSQQQHNNYNYNPHNSQSTQSTQSSQTQSQTDPTTKRLSQTSTSSKKTKTHIGPWRLGRTLGRGSSGRVRLARHSHTGQLAAVKIVPKAVVADAVNAANGEEHGATGLPYGIEREVIIMKLIEHANVMALYDVWENKGELYLVLEYIEGGELFDYLIKKGRLEENEAASYFLQIIHGVDYCHRFNICHRDLKPENLLLDKNRNIKIADFGMAALETDRMLETSCGSPHYASPEIVAGKTYHGAPSDIWSCGIILFALLTGHLPFDDDNIRRLLLKVQTGKFNMPSELSPYAKDLIWRMLRTDPTTRITMDEIFQHPFVRKYSGGRTPTHIHAPSYEHVARPVASVQDIDIEILKNLQILWHGEDAEIIMNKLLSPDASPEKTFYCLLMKYRHDHAAAVAATAPPMLQQQQYNQDTQPSMHKSSSYSSRKQHKRKTSHNSHRLGSRGSLVSVSSAHKRGVSFTHVKKRSQQSIRSMRGSASNSVAASPRKQTASAPVSAGAAPIPFNVNEGPYTETAAVQSAPAAAPTQTHTHVRGTSAHSQTAAHQQQQPPQSRRTVAPAATAAPSWLTRSPPASRDADFEAFLDSAFNKPVKTKKTYGNLLGSPIDSRRHVTDPSNVSIASRTGVPAGNTSKRAVTMAYNDEFEFERPMSLFDPREVGDTGRAQQPSVARAQTISHGHTRDRAPNNADTPNYLPMIFEEGDRFADAIEEEFHLNISDNTLSAPSTNHTTPMLGEERKSSDWENLFEFTERGDQVFVGEDSMLDISFHREPEATPMAPPPANAAATHAGRESTELYKDLQFPEIPTMEREETAVESLARTQSKMKISGQMQTDNFMKRPSSINLNGQLNQGSLSRQSTSASQRRPLVSRDMNTHAASPRDAAKPVKQLQAAAELHEGRRAEIQQQQQQQQQQQTQQTHQLQPAPVFREKPVVSAPRRPAPAPPVKSVADVMVPPMQQQQQNNSQFTIAAPVEAQPAQSKSSRTKSFIRRFGFAPKREAPAAPVSKVTMIQSSDFGAAGTPQNTAQKTQTATSANETRPIPAPTAPGTQGAPQTAAQPVASGLAPNGDPWNVTQSWFMKMFSRPNPGTKEAPQTLYSSLASQQLEDEIVALLASWRKFGISNLSVSHSSIKCQISSRNALKIKSAKLHIDIGPLKHTQSFAHFFHDRGSQSSFTQLYDQIKAHLVSQGLLIDN